MDFLFEVRRIFDESFNIRLMILQAIVTQACFGMFNVIWQPYLIELNTTLPQIGIIQGIVTVFTAIGALIWGRLSDTLGRKPIYVASSVFKLIAIIFYLTATGWISFIGFAVFIGLSASWMHSNPVTSALLTESVEKDNISTAISIYSSVGTIVAIVVAPLGGYIAVERGFQIIFISCIAGEFFNSIFLTVFLKETLKKSQPNLRFNLSPRAFIDFIKPEKVILPFYIVTVLDAIGWRVSLSNLNAILVDSYAYTMIQLGFISSVFSLSWGLTQTPIGVLIDRSSKKKFLVASNIAYIVVTLCYFLSKSFIVFLIAQIFNGLAHSFWIPAFTTMVIGSVPESKRATALGKLSTYPQIFGFIAPYVGGILYEELGFQMLLIIRIIQLLLSLSIIISFIEEN